MIAKLTGKVDTLDLDHVVLDVGGVGYLVSASTRTLSQLADGQVTSLLIETVVRQEQLFLYGFLSSNDRQWFRLLLSVQGVGARMGLSIQAVLSSAEIAHAIAMQDKVALTRADGVGPKLAGRIVSELKDKVGSLSIAVDLTSPQSMPTTTAMTQALSALVNLGYRHSDVSQIISRLVKNHGENVEMEVLIREGLAMLSNPHISARLQA